MLEVSHGKQLLQQVFKTVILELPFGLDNHNNGQIREAVSKPFKGYSIKEVMNRDCYVQHTYQKSKLSGVRLSKPLS